MDQGMFRAWLAEIDGLTAKQRQELEAVLAGRQPRAAVAAAIEERLGEARRCPHCGGASVGGGQADGLRRFRCKDCRRSFNALTGTPLARLHKKERWLDFGQSLSEGETVAASAERCRVAVSTAFRWRHRFLRAAKNPTRLLSGIVEVDETYILSSRKGERRLGRKARRRGQARPFGRTDADPGGRRPERRHHQRRPLGRDRPDHQAGAGARSG
jgi:transposase-like protein